MSRISDEKLCNLKGGTTGTISGPIISAFTNVIKVLFDAGQSLGSAIRRITEGNLCPLE